MGEGVLVVRGPLPEWTEIYHGYGYGSGSGYGYGDGYGYGYGYGSGSGSGYGASLGLLACELIKPYIEDHGWLSLWKSNDVGLPCNGGADSTAAFAGKVDEIKGPLKICTNNALHATSDPDKWKGDRLWLVSMDGELQFSGDKVGSLRRRILCEIDYSLIKGKYKR